MKDNDLCIWGDNWCIEDDKAWFVCGQRNILCCLDMKTNRCELLVSIPDTSVSTFRWTPRCMKYQNYIYCMPDYGVSIWIYDVGDGRFDEMYIDNPDKKSLQVHNFWEHSNKIYAVSYRLKQVIEINPLEKKIENYYPICKEGSIGASVKAGSSIYILFGEIGEIYQFDLETKEIFAHKLPKTGRRFINLCLAGKEFWLGGYRKEIYIWDTDKNTVKIIDGFPKDFGMYDFTKETDGNADSVSDEYEFGAFIIPIVVEQNIWFIPYCTNKIVYINKETRRIQAFEIEEENETKESILTRTSLGYKYLLDYVKDDRYIGLYSLKNNCILEIDTAELKYEYRHYEYSVSDRCIEQYASQKDFVFYESDAIGREAYRKIICWKSNNERDVNERCIGNEIYMKIAYDCV